MNTLASAELDDLSRVPHYPLGTSLRRSLTGHLTVKVRILSRDVASVELLALSMRSPLSLKAPGKLSRILDTERPDLHVYALVESLDGLLDSLLSR